MICSLLLLLFVDQFVGESVTRVFFYYYFILGNQPKFLIKFRVKSSLYGAPMLMKSCLQMISFLAVATIKRGVLKKMLFDLNTGEQTAVQRSNTFILFRS